MGGGPVKEAPCGGCIGPVPSSGRLGPGCNPYRIDPDSPWYHVLNVSGGRASAYMLGQILMAHGGELPPRCEAVFANTGKERAETLDFVQALSDRWGVPIT